MLEDIDPSYDECPLYCQKYPKRKENYDFCKVCEVGIAKKEFQIATEEILTERFGEDWHEYGFDNLYQQVRLVYDTKQSVKDLSVYTQTLVDIISSEEARQQRIDRYNLNQKLKSQGTE